jgi:uncharacterized protein YbjT (DUF2867 family)
MKVLLAGANSYIGMRLIPVLLEKGHQVVCLVRDKGHFYKSSHYSGSVTAIGGDLLRRQSIEDLPADIDAAYYLVNSFTQTSEFAALGALSAQNFMEALGQVNCRHIITLSDINDRTTGTARSLVEDILCSGKPKLTVLYTTMMIGHGSTALEMFVALTAKNPIVIPQNWMKARAQPISTTDVLGYLEACLLNEKTFNKKFDIGGPEVLSFKQLLLMYIATNKGVRPGIVVLPFLTSQLSAHLLNTLTPISYPGAQSLVENLKYDTICRDNGIRDIIPLPCFTFKQSLRLANDRGGRIGMQNTPLFKNN